jgi:hypothetical protein
LRLTLVGCEELRIWKKQWFRLKAAAKQIWRRPYPSKISRSMKRKPTAQQRREEGERRERGCITQASKYGMKTQLTEGVLSRADARILLVSLVTS